MIFLLPLRAALGSIRHQFRSYARDQFRAQDRIFSAPPAELLPGKFRGVRWGWKCACEGTRGALWDLPRDCLQERPRELLWARERARRRPRARPREFPRGSTGGCSERAAGRMRSRAPPGIIPGAPPRLAPSERAVSSGLGISLGGAPRGDSGGVPEDFHEDEPATRAGVAKAQGTPPGALRTPPRAARGAPARIALGLQARQGTLPEQ